MTMGLKGEQLNLTRGIWESPQKEAALQLSINSDFCTAIVTPGTFWPGYFNPDILMWPKTTNHYTSSCFINYQVMCKTEDLTPFPTLTLMPASTPGKSEVQGWSGNSVYLCSSCTKNGWLTTFGHFIKSHQSYSINYHFTLQEFTCILINTSKSWFFPKSQRQGKKVF